MVQQQGVSQGGMGIVAIWLAMAVQVPGARELVRAGAAAVGQHVQLGKRKWHEGSTVHTRTRDSSSNHG